MSKPNGLGFVMEDGAVMLRVNPRDRTVDAIWDAVEQAILKGWTAAQIKSEVAQCFCEVHRQIGEDGKQELR